MTRQPTPDILGAILGSPPTPPTPPPPPVAPAPLLRSATTLDAAGLTPAVYRSAVRLVARGGTAGVMWLSPEESAAVFGVAEYGAQRAHLYHLKRAGIVDYARSDGWFVRLCAPIRALALQNRAGDGDEPLQNRALTLQIRAEDETEPLQNGAPTLQIRADETEPLQKGALALQKGAPTLQNRAEPDTTTNTVCLIVDTVTNNQSNNAPAPEPEPPFLPDPDEAQTARRLLCDIGVIPVTANAIVARRSLLDVRRVVGHGWANRREIGGNLDNWLGFVVKALSFPDRHGIPAAISPNFLHSNLHLTHLTPAELAEMAEYEAAAALEPELLPELVRVADEDVQHEPANDAPAGFDPGQVWREFAAGQGPDFVGTRLLRYDPDTGAAVIVAPVGALDWLRTRGAIVARKRASGFGRPVFAEFIAEEEPDETE